MKRRREGTDETGVWKWREYVFDRFVPGFIVGGLVVMIWAKLLAWW
jgi:hypothetical protein